MQKTELKSEIKVGKYMNLLNDWGFKHVFSKEKYMVHFLNLIFHGKEEIKQITYLPTELAHINTQINLVTVCKITHILLIATFAVKPAAQT
jgi:hypothetical protein